MAKSYSGAMPYSRVFHGIEVTNERNPAAALVNAMDEVRERVLMDFPELTGHDALYCSLTQADFSDDEVLGMYDDSKGRITIRNDVAAKRDERKGWAGGNSLQHAVAHELAHALTGSTPKGFVDTDTAFNRAFKQYRRTNPTATQEQFSIGISRYALEAKSEAFAEAFADYNRNGRNAALASRLVMEKWRN